MNGRKEDAVYGLLDLEIARQRREELLREAQEGRMARAAARVVEAGGERMAFVRRLLRSVRPEEPVCGCSAD